MRVLCDNCKFNNHIEEYRDMLSKILHERRQNSLDDDVMELSRSLDNFVSKCVFCNKNMQSLSKLNLKNVFGTHTTFYYYGEHHLFINLYFYINEGIKNNELIYISMEENLYNRLLDFLKTNKVLTENIKFESVKQLILGNKRNGLNGLKETAQSILASSGIENYSGIRWIGQPTYAIEGTSEKDFLDMEINLNKFVKNMNAGLLCVYDAYDYMHEGRVVNETVIQESLRTHSFILNNFAV